MPESSLGGAVSEEVMESLIASQEVVCGGEHVVVPSAEFAFHSMIAATMAVAEQTRPRAARSVHNADSRAFSFRLRREALSWRVARLQPVFRAVFLLLTDAFFLQRPVMQPVCTRVLLQRTVQTSSCGL